MSDEKKLTELESHIIATGRNPNEPMTFKALADLHAAGLLSSPSSAPTPAAARSPRKSAKKSRR